MPTLLYARPPREEREERQVRTLAHSAHAPADWVWHARMIARSWDGWRTSVIATDLGCHMQTVRERLHACNERGLDGLGIKPGGGRPPRITEAERSAVIALVATPPPGRLVTYPDGTVAPARSEGGDTAVWPLRARARRRPRRGASRSGAARCAASCARKGSAGGAPTPGAAPRPREPRTSPQKNGGRHR